MSTMTSFYNDITSTALLTSGDINDFNTMTIGWATVGCLWSTKVMIVYVKQNRYTNEFMKKNDYFTVSFYDSKYKKELGYLGTVSGRNEDKVSKSKLVPLSIDKYNTVTFKESNHTFVLKKIYEQELSEKLSKEIMERYYINEPRHIMYVGEIVEEIC